MANIFGWVHAHKIILHHHIRHKDHVAPDIDCNQCMTANTALFTEDFTNITVPKWGRICEQVLAKTGVQIVGDNGNASAKGVTIAWTYDSTALTLELSLLHRSWYDPSADAIDTDIKAWVNAA